MTIKTTSAARGRRRRKFAEETQERRQEADQAWKALNAKAAEFIEQSPVKSEAGKKALAETLAGLLVHQKSLLDRQFMGTITAEEARSLPAVASNINRITTKLQLTEITEEDDIGAF